MQGKITYSEEIPGAVGNYHWPVQFDKTDGYIGITQTCDHGEIERVLLSRAQVKALIAFVGQRQRSAR